MIIDRHYEQWTTIIFDLISKAKNGEEMDSVIRSGLGLYKEFHILLRYIRKNASQSTIPCSSIFDSNENEIPYGNLNQYQNEIEKLVPLEQNMEDLPLSNILEFLIKVQKTLLQKNWALYLDEIESLLVTKKTEFIKRVYTLLKRLK
ncbi:unnamed protein product [Orchesella dallaii]|uniref:Uncharacterized protein n=1 Tax=Orchesella dallaii TaxID=48710 RepID=A0ABP1S1V3_9HEXA